ncbi:MAG: RlmE family RNA methyltransferase [Spirochaetaceae bacterium]|jgi:23S rRNA (uridine2552-2'-O)-methyltransferase|nr:RlmE family RNA methyltransferase [Spirochaetaceae bacterium]
MGYSKPDFWTLKARQEGYPARSVYKLKEMDEKFGLFRSGIEGFRVLDLGAAPGSWSLYALRRMGPGGFLAAVDKTVLSRQYDSGLFGGENVYFVQGDIALPETKALIGLRGPFHLILSDAAPGTTGNGLVDALRSLSLAEIALDYAETFLAPGGHMAVKVFQGGDAPGLLRRIREGFTSGRSFKPQACRSESFEIYYLGLGKL